VPGARNVVEDVPLQAKRREMGRLLNLALFLPENFPAHSDALKPGRIEGVAIAQVRKSTD
jgi:hypothetical protein